jgi:hypothetical protein
VFWAPAAETALARMLKIAEFFARRRARMMKKDEFSGRIAELAECAAQERNAENC